MIGFRASDEDEDTPGQVVDGVASERDESFRDRATTFVDLCSELRSMGCSEVRAGEFRAVWPVQPVTTVPAQVVRQALKREKPKEEPLEKLFDTDTADDLQRRAEYARKLAAIGGVG